MATAAADSFKSRSDDVTRLIEIHTEIAGEGAGRKYGVDVLNRSAIVLLTAVWEGYVEDLAAEAIAHLVDHTQDPDELPLDLRKRVASEIRADANHLAPWTLASDGWRAHLKVRLQQDAEERARMFNTPMTQRVDALFESALGMKDLSSNWHWNHMPTATAATKLDELVRLRGDIAHGQGQAITVRKGGVTGHLRHVKQLVRISDTAVRSYLQPYSATPLFVG